MVLCETTNEAPVFHRPVRFRTLAQDSCSGARSGVLETSHGCVATPAFMPVGTQATIKGLTPEQIRDTGTLMLLANTYHLALRPGEDEVAALGGLHSFARDSERTDSARIPAVFGSSAYRPEPADGSRGDVLISPGWKHPRPHTPSGR